MTGEVPSTPDIEAVRQFWNQHPLFVGEARHAAGERAFFEEHRRIIVAEHSGAIDPIFTRDIRPGQRVLDVGCGIGFWVQHLSATGALVSACDLTPAAVEITRQRIAMYGLSADVQVGNAEALPYADGQFDHVNCQGVIHHTPDTARCIAEFARVLRPGGTASVSVYYRSLVLESPRLYKLVVGLARPFVKVPGRGREQMLLAATPDELVRQYDGAGNPIGRAYTRDEFRALLGNHLELVEFRRFGFPRRFLPIGVPDAVHRTLSRSFGLMLLARCRKPA